MIPQKMAGAKPKLSPKEMKAIALGEQSPEPPQEEKKPSQKKILMEFMQRAEMWHDTDGDAFCTVKVGNHVENLTIRSRAFRDWLTKQYYEKCQEPPGTQAIEEATRVFESEAKFSGKKYQSAQRIGRIGSDIYLFLADDEHRAVHVSASGWKLITNAECPIKFVMKKGQRALPVPKSTTRTLIDLLFNVLTNITDPESKVLIAAWLMGCMNPNGPFPILRIEAEQGSGKSFLSKVLKRTIDPSTVDIARSPKNEDDLVVTAQCYWVVSYDNLSGISEDLSDGLCRLATGGGLQKRQLYTDAELISLDAKRPVIINGIDDDSGRDDLRDRMITIRLNKLTNDTRRSEEELTACFELAHPEILGSLLNAVSCALRDRGKVRLEVKSRMLDFAEFISAAESALGIGQGAFAPLYEKHRQQQAQDNLESSPVAQAIINLIEVRHSWKGTLSELLKELKCLCAPEYRFFPQTPRGLSNMLNRLSPGLRMAGYEIAKSRTAESRYVEITKSRQTFSHSVTEPPKSTPSVF